MQKLNEGLLLGSAEGLSLIEGNYPDFAGIQQLEHKWVSAAVSLGEYEVTKGKDSLVLWKRK